MIRLIWLAKAGDEIQIRFSIFYPVPYPFRIPSFELYFITKILKKILVMRSAVNVMRFTKAKMKSAPPALSKKVFAINAFIFEKKPLSSLMEILAKC